MFVLEKLSVMLVELWDVIVGEVIVLVLVLLILVRVGVVEESEIRVLL